MELETRKILGHVNKDNMSFIQRSDSRVSATCTRVNVTDGHMAFVSLRFAKRPLPSAEQVKKAMRGYISDAQRLGCPSAPDPAITILEQLDRPQPRLDRDVGRGYSVSVGRVREDKTGVFDLMFAALSHNSKSILHSTILLQLTNPHSYDRCCWIVNTVAEATVLKAWYEFVQENQNLLFREISQIRGHRSRHIQISKMIWSTCLTNQGPGL